ncbi:hypothetical protein [Ponticaulis profundi]|uniref:Uncharacterized protein n=1 Tax=Ponticaulis profundi TaxID=2665222 RepID=A0ABW1S832_9PROT
MKKPKPLPQLACAKDGHTCKPNEVKIRDEQLWCPKCAEDFFDAPRREREKREVSNA